MKYRQYTGKISTSRILLVLRKVNILAFLEKNGLLFNLGIWDKQNQVEIILSKFIFVSTLSSFELFASETLLLVLKIYRKSST